MAFVLSAVELERFSWLSNPSIERLLRREAWEPLQVDLRAYQLQEHLQFQLVTLASFS